MLQSPDHVSVCLPDSLCQGRDQVVQNSKHGRDPAWVHDQTHDCLGDVQDYVYAFRPLEAVTVNISLCESSFDTKLILYEETTNSSDLTLLSCNDDGCDTQSWLQVTHFHHTLDLPLCRGLVTGQCMDRIQSF